MKKLDGRLIEKGFLGGAVYIKGDRGEGIGKVLFANRLMWTAALGVQGNCLHALESSASLKVPFPILFFFVCHYSS